MHSFTDAQITANFNRVLDGIVSGELHGCPTDNGIDMETAEILNLLAAQPDPKSPADIVACRTEFGRQMDGTHDREWEEREAEEWSKLLGG